MLDYSLLALSLLAGTLSDRFVAKVFKATDTRYGRIATIAMACPYCLLVASYVLVIPFSNVVTT